MSIEKPTKHEVQPDRRSDGRKADLTRQRILVAAARAISAKGFAEASVRDIANLVGVKAGSIYYHFDSKETIVDEILAESVKLLHESVEEALTKLPPHADFTTRLKTAIRTHLETISAKDTDQGAFFHVYQNLPPILRNRNSAQRTRYGHIWRDLVKGGIKSGEFRANLDADLYVVFLLGALAGTVNWFDPLRRSIAEFIELIVDVQLLGITARHKRRA